jgi:hypothetical protein
MLEKQIEKKVCDYAKSKGVMVYKFTSPAHFAVPDRMFIFNGKVWFIEFKAPGKKPTAPQTREINRLLTAGISVYVIDDVIVGKGVIDHEVS